MALDIVKFFRETRQESRKVTWPTQKETVTTTIVVFVMVIIMAAILFAADWIIGAVVKFILGLGA